MKFYPLNEHRLRADAETFTERLMQPDDWEDEDRSHIDVVEEVLHNMDEKMMDVVRAIYFERIPYSELGRRLGCSKTQAWRKAKQAEAWVANAIANNYTLKARYNMFENWNDAALAVIESYERGVARPALIDVINFCGRELVASVKAHREPPSYAFNTIGMEAVSQLRNDNEWDTSRFHTLLCGKQHDYGHENILAFGITGVAVRMHDKIARLNNLLCAHNKPINETLVDTWSDLVGYSVIAEMLGNNTFTLNLKEQHAA